MRDVRSAVRQRSEQRKEAKRRQGLALALGWSALEKMEQQQNEKHQRWLMGIAAFVKLLARERREITAAAISELLDHSEYQEAEVEAGLQELRASGQYEEIIAEENDANPAG